MSFFHKFFGGESTAAEKYAQSLAEVNSYKDEVAGLTKDQIQKEIQEIKLEIKELESDKEIFDHLREIAPRVFALTREAAKRSIGQFHYDVQAIGGFVLADSKIAEMKTGEGKTLTATLPLVLFSLAGRGAHLVTVNDYLARWQASLMGPVYKYLGLTTASIQHEASFMFDDEYQPEAAEIEQIEGETQGLVMDVKHMKPISRKEAYGADITYGTNNEYGFDFLRDNMVQNVSQLVQRELFFAIVDEVDSILVDEARTPLIISSPDSEPTSKYYDFAKLVGRLDDKSDYTVDEKHKAASLSDAGISKIEEILKIPNIYDTSKGVTTIHHIEQALRARTLFKIDRDYVVREGEIIIVDEFTGRLMFGRRYSEGLHQAIEAKENVKIQAESKTLATITFQNLFRLYKKLSGMTGTAKTEEEEFFKIYQLTVEQVPTNKEMVRIDLPDAVYKSEEAKYKAIALEVKARHKKGQPVLIGTVSIAKNEMLSDVLKKEGLTFELLNAKNHEREAHIISQAGRPGQITLATNIAGRGVDILLGGNPIDQDEAKKVREAGGVHILGTERHESRRIDNQLRGRAGRQGDPGSSQFFVSMEDDLMRLFGGERMKSIMTRMGLPDDQPIEHGMVSKSIEQAQKKIEGLNFDTRKNVLEFDDVLNHQRNIIYKKRRGFLAGTEESKQINLKQDILEIAKTELGEATTFHLNQVDESGGRKEDWDNLFKGIGTIIPIDQKLIDTAKEAASNAADKEFAITDVFYKAVEDYWDVKEKEMGKEVFEGAQRFVALQALDNLWMEHLDTMDHLRDSVRLRGYGQRDPLVEYKKEGYIMFQNLVKEINKQIIYTIFHITVQVNQQAVEQKPLKDLITTSASGSSQTSSIDPKYDGVGRNDACPCGSGKKFKKCHGKNA
ncbi:MAG: preprotein translocase subunit SecA [Candidatus Doudnabacteria bacterium]|jgi:preprotein translocase subunit SecA